MCSIGVILFANIHIKYIYTLISTIEELQF